MSDLIERLKSAKRKIEAYVSFYRPKGMGKTTLWRVHDCVTEAAAEIASLRSQLEELSEKLMLHQSDAKMAWGQCDGLRMELAEASSQLEEARRKALEEAARYHDDLSAEHDACGYESQHHEMMTKAHRRFAAAIRSLSQERTDVHNL